MVSKYPCQDDSTYAEPSSMYGSSGGYETVSWAFRIWTNCTETSASRQTPATLKRGTPWRSDMPVRASSGPTCCIDLGLQCMQLRVDGM